MKNPPRSRWLDVLSARGLDVEALAAGEAGALADLDRHVAELAAMAARAELALEAQARETAQAPAEVKPQAAREAAWAGTQAARLAAMAREAA